MHLRRLALLSLLVATVASAESVQTGRPVYLTRGHVQVMPHMEFVEPTGDGQIILLIGVDSSIHVGDLFDLVDKQGFAGQVRVETVDRTDEHCKGFVYQKARARRIGGRDANKYEAVAIGPAKNGGEASAKLYDDPGKAIDLPPPGAAQGLKSLIDRDGDGVPDLARYLYECSQGPQSNWNGKSEICIEDWVRLRGGWQRISLAQLNCK